jgi:hypothetical protein
MSGAQTIVPIAGAVMGGFPQLKISPIDHCCTGIEAKPTDGLDCPVGIEAVEELSETCVLFAHELISEAVMYRNNTEV